MEITDNEEVPEYKFNSPEAYNHFIVVLTNNEVDFIGLPEELLVIVHQDVNWPNTIGDKWSIDNLYEYVKDKHKDQRFQKFAQAMLNSKYLWTATKIAIPVILLAVAIRVVPIVYNSGVEIVDKQVTSITDNFNQQVDNMIPEIILPNFDAQLDKVTDNFNEQVSEAIPEAPVIKLPTLPTFNMPKLSLPTFNNPLKRNKTPEETKTVIKATESLSGDINVWLEMQEMEKQK